MSPRVHVEPQPGGVWSVGLCLDLPPTAVRHIQVLRLQPGSGLVLFDGRGGQWTAQVEAMGRQSVRAVLLAHDPVERELPLAVTLAVCMPANDRMDDLVQKASELGVAAIVPLMSERSVLRLSGERSLKKQAHWQAVAVAACEQSGRNRVPLVAPVQGLSEWLVAARSGGGAVGSEPAHVRWQLSLSPRAQPLQWALAQALEGHPARPAIDVLSGPEGGLTEAEQAQALHGGWSPVGLGPRTLRADTAPLAALAAISVLNPGSV